MTVLRLTRPAHQRSIPSFRSLKIYWHVDFKTIILFPTNELVQEHIQAVFNSFHGSTVIFYSFQLWSLTFQLKIFRIAQFENISFLKWPTSSALQVCFHTFWNSRKAFRNDHSKFIPPKCREWYDVHREREHEKSGISCFCGQPWKWIRHICITSHQVLVFFPWRQGHQAFSFHLGSHSLEHFTKNSDKLWRVS